jgi:hypothetical protein
VILVALGSSQCGGLWESVGPLDLTRIGVPIGGLYHVQLVFFEDHYSGWRSNGFSCIRVSNDLVTDVPLSVATRSWGGMKILFR